MSIGEELNKPLVIARERQFDPYADDDLRSFVRLLHRYVSSQAAPPEVLLAIQAFENELARRQLERQQIEQKKQHEEALQENQRLLSAVQELKEPHWTLTPTFWISLGVLLVAIASLVVAIWQLVK